MRSNKSNDERIVTEKVGDLKPMVTDFGTRAILNQNFSKMVALPKVALTNLGKVTHVNVKLVQENGERYIKLTPMSGGKKDE